MVGEKSAKKLGRCGLVAVSLRIGIEGMLQADAW
jgi:hypothetical protein